MYEGTLAVAQTAILGLYFTAAFLARRRLLAVVVAHATFNAVMFVFVRAILASGAIDRLKALAPH
jgi:membrane protease YdiL (CAAX protease family)